MSDAGLRWRHSWGNVVSVLFNRNLHCTVPIKLLNAPFKVKVMQTYYCACFISCCTDILNARDVQRCFRKAPGIGVVLSLK